MKTQKSWDNFYMRIAKITSELSYAEDKKVGCIIVKEGNILSFSYNGTARGTCNETQEHGKTLPEVLHAETQAIAKMAKEGIPTLGCTIYSTLSPCIDCAKMIYQAGIARLVYDEEYKDTLGIKFLKDNGVVVNEIITNHMLFKDSDLKYTGLLE